MDPISVRDLVPRLALGLVIALAAAAGVYALNNLDRAASDDGMAERIASRV